VFAYRVRWTWLLAMTSFIVVAWAVWVVLSERRPTEAPRWLVPVSVSALLVLATVSSVDAARAHTPQQPEESTVAALWPQVLRSLPRGDGDVTLRATSFGSSFYLGGTLLGLERKGVTARVDESVGWIYGAHRAHRTGRVRADLWVVTDRDVELFLRRPDLRLVAYDGTLPIPERARVLARLEASNAAHADGRLTDAGWLRQLIPLQKQLGTAVAVFAARAPQ
jgi:hypothetical protein